MAKANLKLDKSIMFTLDSGAKVYVIHGVMQKQLLVELKNTIETSFYSRLERASMMEVRLTLMEAVQECKTL